MARMPRVAAFVAAGAAGLAGVVLAATLTAGGAWRPSGVAAPSSSPTPAVANGFSAGGLQDPAAPAPTVAPGAPVSIRIPSIGVSSKLESLTIGDDGRLAAPADFDRAGWYAAGPAPGEVGPAIIAGHVDSTTGPAVFYRLAELKIGDRIEVRTAKGTSLTFTVTARTQSAKATFPTSAVYSNVPRPELRLITCAGFFDRSTGHYVDNLIVFAALDG